MAERSLGQVLLAAVISLAIGWFLMWLIASYNPAIAVDPITTTYYNISSLGWLGILALIAIIFAGVAAFKIKPKKSKKGSGNAIIIAVVIGFCLGLFASWLIACYVPELLIQI